MLKPIGNEVASAQWWVPASADVSPPACDQPITSNWNCFVFKANYLSEAWVNPFTAYTATDIFILVLKLNVCFDIFMIKQFITLHAYMILEILSQVTLFLLFLFKICFVFILVFIYIYSRLLQWKLHLKLSITLYWHHRFHCGISLDLIWKLNIELFTIKHIFPYCF